MVADGFSMAVSNYQAVKSEGDARPYLSGGGHYIASAAIALLALFGIGYVKGIVLLMSRWRAGLETLLMGGAAAGIAFLFGYFLEPLLAGLDIN